MINLDTKNKNSNFNHSQNIIVLISALFLLIFSFSCAKTIPKKEASVIESDCVDISKNGSISKKKYANNEGPKTPLLLDIEVQNNTKGKREWQNQLIQDGIDNLLIEELNKRGNYIAIEKNSEILNRIKKLKEEQKTSELNIYSDNNLAFIGTKAVAFGTIVNSEVYRNEFHLGFLGIAQSTVQVVFQVTLKEPGIKRNATACTEANTNSKGFIYTIRDDKIYFDKSSIGKTTTKAVEIAVSKLFSQ